MVPVSEGPTIAAIRASLVSAARVDGETPLLLAFRSFMLGEHGPLAALATDASEALASPGARSAAHVAVLGYAAAAHVLAGSLVPALADGIVWLSERPWNRPLREATLEVDGLSMLGVALGARGSDGSALATLTALAAASAGRPNLSDFNLSLMVAAAHILSAPGRPDLSAMLPEARVAFADLGLMPRDEGSGPPAWRNAVRLAPGEGGTGRAALTLRAFDALCERNIPARLGRLEVEDVVRVLKGVERSMQEWTWEDRSPTPKSAGPVKWQVRNEYHVQNLLWAVLAPLFPDLCREEYTSPVGHKNPRMDLTIPSLKLVIEAKFMRPGKSFADIQEEVSADNTLYGADPKWEVLIPFVWDDSRRSEHHATLIEGMRRMSMVPDAIVMSRPGKMDVPEGEAPRPIRGKPVTNGRRRPAS
ncbi:MULTISPECIES: hypothetical protein [Methylobacterium]|uniref:PD-(D/E)XK nuclease domain-containing protein n=1 Tax=Methylobacterium TaxID=407 RepID=UPI000AB95AA4|nr:hypothetical protein [Methylobacterium sp. Leaf104]MCI9878873.1 hypothetical protein [Methylobacterium goesingense]